MTRTLATAAALSVAAGLAHAQTVNVFIEVDEPILAPGDSTTVRLLGGWSGTDYAVAGVLTDLLYESAGVDVSAAWSGAGLIAPMNGPGTSAGVPETGRHADIIAGQLNFPVAGIYAWPQPNPIPFWEITFTAPLDADGYTVDLSTLTQRFDVYVEQFSARSESRLDVLVEGSGQIYVVPAPATSAALALGLLALRRRR